jgi:subtilisin family serine protease
MVRTRVHRLARFAAAFAAAAGLTVAASAGPPAGGAVVTAPARTSVAAVHNGTAAGGPEGFRAGRYLVTFAAQPVVSYAGNVDGFAATRPAKGEELEGDSAAVRAWRARLVQRHDTTLDAVGATAIYDYTVTNNGVAADLSARQAAELAKLPGVLSLERDRREQVDTTLSPHFLGLDAPGGLWSQLGGPKNAGAGVVVGMLDSGIWPESAAFAGNTGIPVPAGWAGACQGGEQFARSNCNDKLIGARYYVAGFGKTNVAAADFLSPRDGSGHGSHTSSTAAGDNGTSVSIEGQPMGTASGMAPGAKLAMYKVCWEGKPGVAAGCFNSDSVAAINQAVLDGVDVINYSIGGSSEASVLGSVEQAFRGAANAGVFVAVSAGNNGPGPSTLDHPSPWLTTVAAATHRRAFQAVELGDGQRFVGASTTPPLPDPAPLVTATSVKLADAPDDEAALCFDGTLDPAKTTGKVVVCDRGVNARIDKSFEVQRAGGVGMVLANTSPSSLNGDFHAVPSVHVDDVDGAAIKAYVQAAGDSATATITPLTRAELDAAPQVPEITDFSSRGPSTTTGGDILKPDIAAPGNDVIAAVAPPTNHGRSWDFMSGTSMASPHIAGIAALLTAAHPQWTPAEIKSAIMTSAGDTVSSAGDPFAQGAGFVSPNTATNPGLVYPAGPNDWRRYMVGLGVRFAPPFDTLTPLDGSDLNQASIAVGKLAGIQTVTRTVTNVGSTATTYRANVRLPGFDVEVSPQRLTLAPGESREFTVTFTRDTATLGQWAIGSLTWTDRTHRVRTPIAAQPVVVSAPTEVHADASAAGSQDFTVTPGFTGSLDTAIAGLVGVTPTTDSVTSGAFDTANPTTGPQTKLYSVDVPDGTAAARFSLDSADDTADLDLYVYRDGRLVALSASGAADEQATLIRPAAGSYDVYVNGFATPGGSTTYQISNFVVDPAAAGNATVTPDPAQVTIATQTTLTANWTGLDPAKRWLGVISYSGSDDVTLLSVG